MTPTEPGHRPAPGAAAPPPPSVALPPRGMYEVEEFPRMPWRRRLWVTGLALATAAVVMGSVLAPPGGSKAKRLPPPDAARCANGQDTGCVGGTATVIMAPPLAASARVAPPAAAPEGPASAPAAAPAAVAPAAPARR